jgi:transcriptional regulator with XRE-family HTH domain
MATATVGSMLRDWREDRRRSQMDLALDVGVSTRHLSFVETGKSKPSPELVLALAENLDVPLRERNALLLAAGYAPRYQQTPLDDEAMARVRQALGALIRAHDPYPAVVVDRRWDVVMANTGAQALLEGVAPHLLGPPLNAYRATLHPEGMAPRIENLAEWAHHLLGTLDRQVAITRDSRLRELLDEVRGYPNIAALDGSWRTRSGLPAVLVPLRLRRGDGAVQSWFSTNTSIGTPVDITLDELHVELFHPADEATAAMVGGPGPAA